MKSLTDYIHETKNNIASIGVETFNKYFADFDITRIPLSIRKKVIIDYKTISDFTDDVSEEYIYGSKEDVYETKKSSKQVAATQVMLNELKNKYKMDDYNFLTFDPYNESIVKVDKIPNYLQTTNSVLMPKILENVQVIKTEICSQGYYVVSEKTYYDKETDVEWVRLIFAPSIQEDISTQIRNHIDILYYWSPFANKKSIEEKGIIPSNEGRVYTYSNKRVCLCTVGSKDRAFNKMMVNTTKNRKRKNKDFDGKYNIYAISLRKLPNDMKLYLDPHGKSKNCIYVTKTIPYNSIIDIEEKQY